MRYLLLFAFAFYYISISSSCNKSDDKTIIVGYLPIIAHLPAAIAKENGYFGNLKIEFKAYGSSDDLLSDLTNNKIDIATTIALAPVLRNTTVKNEANVIIFSYSRSTKTNPFDGVFTQANSNLNDLNQLSGKRIGVFPGSTAKNMLSLLLKEKYKINPDSINWVYLPPTAQLDALDNHDIDALFTYETIRTVATIRNYKMIHGSVIADVLENAPYGCSAMSQNFYSNYPELAKTFIDGFDKGINLIRINEIKSRNVLVSQLGVSPDIATNCNIEQRLNSSEISKPENKKVFIDFIKILYKSGDINSDSLNYLDNLIYLDK